MNQEARFNDHVAHIEKKARQKIGWITHSFYTGKTQFMKQIYKSLVIPHLDNCSQLWMPVETSKIEKIEKLQRDYLRKIPELKHMSYRKNLKKLNMLSLQRRMERYRVIYCWKILSGFAPNCGIFEVEGSADSRLGRKLKVPEKKSNAKCQKMRD